MSAPIIFQFAPLPPLFAISLRYDRPIRAMQNQNNDPIKCLKKPGVSSFVIFFCCTLAELRSILINSSRYFSVRLCGNSNLCALLCMRSESRSASEAIFLASSSRIIPAEAIVHISKNTVTPAQAMTTMRRNLREPVGGSLMGQKIHSILIAWLSRFWMFSISACTTKKKPKAYSLTIICSNLSAENAGDISNSVSHVQSVAISRTNEVADEH